MSRRDAIAKAFRIAKRGEALENLHPWSTLVSKNRHREFADDLEAALAQEGYVIMPMRNPDNVWPAITNLMAHIFFDAFNKAHEHHGFYESFYAGYNAMIKVATQQGNTEKTESNFLNTPMANQIWKVGK